MNGKEAILSCQNLYKKFGGVLAVDNVNLTLNRGDILGLVGENGAGKTTLIKLLTGEYQKDRGRVFNRGVEVSWSDSHKALISGVGLVHQKPLLVPELTAAENIFLGKEPTKTGLINRSRIIQKAGELLKRYPINPEFDLELKIKEMSAGQREITEILKVLSYNPQVLILDEPTASLTESESKNLISIVIKLNQENGLSCIFISHRLEEVFDICTRIEVLRNGKNVGVVERDNFNRNKIIHMIINRSLSEYYPSKTEKVGEVLLEARNIHSDRLNKVNIKVHAGEIVGLYGIRGAGMNEVVESICGLADIKNGSIVIEGEEIKDIQFRKLIEKMIYLIPEDRDLKGLFSKFTLGENLTIAHLNHLIPQFIINRRKENKIAEQAVSKFNIVCQDVNQEIHMLSGGNQQKVVIAKWLFRDCKVLMLDDVTAGIDIGAKREVYLMLRKLTGKGNGVVFISSDILEIIGMADRIYTMRGGTITSELKGDRITQKIILEHVL